MSWLYQHKQTIRILFLLLFIIAVLGPWTYTMDGVPPPEWCDEHYVLIAEDRCASLVSGITILAWLPMMAASVVAELFRQGPGILGRVFFVIALYALLILPPTSSLLLLRRGESLRRQRIQLAVLLFAVLAGGLLPYLMTRVDRVLAVPRFWGIWLFVIVSAVALLFELLLRQRRPPFRSRQLAPTNPAA